MAVRIEKDGINWAVLLNAGLLVIIIIGAWFTTFSNPLQEKFIQAEKSQTDQTKVINHSIDMVRIETMAAIAAQKEATNIAFAATERLNKEIEASLSRRFASQDKANGDLERAMIARLDEREKAEISLRKTIDDLVKIIEQRRIEIATRSEVSQGLAATRLEFLAEIKRLDGLTQAAMPRTEFSVWRQERDVLAAQNNQRMEAMELWLRQHERIDRESDKADPAKAKAK